MILKENKDENVHRYEVWGGKKSNFWWKKSIFRLASNWFCTKTCIWLVQRPYLTCTKTIFDLYKDHIWLVQRPHLTCSKTKFDLYKDYISLIDTLTSVTEWVNLTKPRYRDTSYQIISNCYTCIFYLMLLLYQHNCTTKETSQWPKNKKTYFHFISICRGKI